MPRCLCSCDRAPARIGVCLVAPVSDVLSPPVPAFLARLLIPGEAQKPGLPHSLPSVFGRRSACVSVSSLS